MLIIGGGFDCVGWVIVEFLVGFFSCCWVECSFYVLDLIRLNCVCFNQRILCVESQNLF